ncbi:MAG TPA: carboxypeptidase-like regulatory domain-containing protein [Bryobacteraceae bacterium]|nr:carboxypeptidase-like regulatory domain-containing protein [Bryobacteraceae bacterium]
MYLNTPYAGRIVQGSGDVTESLLIVDDPASPVLGVNVYQAKQTDENSITFQNVAFPATGNAWKTIRIVNVRTNVAALTLPTPYIPLSVLAFVSVTNGIVPLLNPQIPVGMIHTAQHFQLTDAVGQPSTALTFNGAGTQSFRVRFSEATTAGFRKRNVGTMESDPLALAAQTEYGRNYYTESGFYIPSLLPGNVGLAAHGTRLRTRITNLPPGVTLTAGLQAASGSSNTIRARLLAPGIEPNAAFAPAVSGSLAIINGEAEAFWEIVEADGNALESLQFEFTAVTTSASVGQAGATGELAPRAPNASTVPRFEPVSINASEQCGTACLVVPSIVKANYALGGAPPQPLSIPILSTAGTIPFRAVVVASEAADGSAIALNTNWISITPATGSAPGTLTATITPQNLPPGNYQASIVFNAGLQTATTTVLLQVTGTPADAAIPSCQMNPGVPPIVRDTGRAERLGDLVANCQGLTAPVTTDLYVALNTLIASRSNDVLALVDEPASTSQAIGTNVFRGERIGDSQVVFRNLYLPAMNGYSSIRVVNLYADASRHASAGTLIPAQIVSFARFSNLVATNAQQILGYLQPSHQFEIRNSSGQSTSLENANNGKLRFTEGFALSFKKRNEGVTFLTPGTLIPQPEPGTFYTTETGFYNPNLPPGTGIDMGLATQGTRLRAYFSNIPDGMSIEVSVQDSGANPTSPKAQLVQTDANGAGAYQAISGAGTPAFAPVAIQAGSGVAVWEILDSDHFSKETLNFDIRVSNSGQPAPAAMVVGTMAPLAPVLPADSAPQPRFAELTSDSPHCANFPCLKVPSQVTINATGSNPVTKDFPVTSDADPVAFTVAPTTVPWLSVLNSAGKTSSNVTLIADPTGLSAGTHTTEVSVSGRPVSVVFEMATNGERGLWLSKEFLKVSVQSGQSTQAGPITLSGTTGLDWTAASSAPWLTLAAMSGTAPSSIIPLVNASNLMPGEYDGILTFEGTCAVPIQLRVRVTVQGTLSVAGLISISGGGPLVGATVTLSGGANAATTTTSVNGSYAINNLQAGESLTVTPTAPGYRFTPASATLSPIKEGMVANFTATPFNAPPVLTSNHDPVLRGAFQLLDVSVTDENGSNDVNYIYFLVNTSVAITNNTCHGFYDRTTNSFYLYSDTLTLLGPLTAGADGALENSQCKLDGTSSKLVPSSPLRLKISLQLKTPYSNIARNVYLVAQDSAANISGWVSTAEWRPNLPSAPVLETASFTTPDQFIQFRATDADGNLARAYFLIADSPNIQVNGCHGLYDYATGSISIFNDPLTALGTENSRCAVDSSRLTPIQNGLVTLPIRRKGALPARKVYLWIVDSTNLGTGWQDPNLTFAARTNSAPTVSGASPVSANGLSQQFSAQIADADSRYDLNRIYFLINPSPAIPQNTCHGLYDRVTNTTLLFNDTLSAFSPNLENSQCRITNVTAVPVSGSDNALTLSFTATRKGAYLNTPQNVYLWPVDLAANGPGWVPISSWTNGGNNTAPTVVAPNPPSLVGSPQTLSLTVRDADGFADISRVYFLVHPTPEIPQNTCHGLYDRVANQILLYNDALTALSVLTPGEARTIENSRCAIQGLGTSVSGSGSDLTLNLNTTLKTSGSANVYIWPVDAAGAAGSGWVKAAQWTSTSTNAAPTIAVANTTYTGTANQQVTFTAQDANGAQDIQRLYFLVNPTPNIPQNTCHGLYERSTNRVLLYNDTLTALVETLENSRCAVTPNSWTATASGQQLSLTLTMRLKTAHLASAQNVYLWAVDAQSAGTGWVQVGRWTGSTSSQPAALNSVPSVLAGAGAKSIKFRMEDADGSANIARMYFLIADSPTITANGCHGLVDRNTNAAYLYNDALAGLVPAAATLQNSQCAVSASALSFETPDATALHINLPLAVTAPFLGPSKKLYIWVVDAQGNGTGWVQVATWSPV